MGKYTNEFVQRLSACVDECRKTIVQAETVLRSYESDARLRAIRNMHATMIHGIDTFYKDVTNNKLIFEVEKEVKKDVKEVEDFVEGNTKKATTKAKNDG